jgi:hypothetical protein
VFLVDKTSRVRNQGSGEEFESYVHLLPYLQAINAALSYY